MSIVKFITLSCYLTIIWTKIEIPCIHLALFFTEIADDICTKQCWRQCCDYFSFTSCIEFIIFDIFSIVISSMDDNDYDDKLTMNPIVFLQIAVYFGIGNSLRMCCIGAQILDIDCCDKDNYRWYGGIKSKIWMFILQYVYIIIMIIPLK